MSTPPHLSIHELRMAPGSLEPVSDDDASLNNHFSSFLSVAGNDGNSGKSDSPPEKALEERERGNPPVTSTTPPEEESSGTKLDDSETTATPSGKNFHGTRIPVTPRPIEREPIPETPPDDPIELKRTDCVGILEEAAPPVLDIVDKEGGGATHRETCSLCGRIVENSHNFQSWRRHNDISSLCLNTPTHLQAHCKYYACKMLDCAAFNSDTCAVLKLAGHMASMAPCQTKYMCWNCLGVPEQHVAGCFVDHMHDIY